MNITIEEMIRYTLSHSKLPKSFWGKGMRTTIDLISLSHSKKDVSYDHLRVFGCKAFIHVPKNERSKLDVKAKPYIFLGYGREEFGTCYGIQ